jgi:predicted ABC-type transport system involved in lysophospholipase L1 biosynthesis ATPase subunit
VVVTHDETLAAAARRTIHMRDGRIVDDRGNR